MSEITKTLLSLVEQAEAQLREVSDAESGTPVRPNGWSRKEILGHLIDSASNNHQRFVRAALQPSLEFPAYDQNGCVRVQAPAAAEWSCWFPCGPNTTATWRTYLRTYRPGSWKLRAASDRASP